MKHNWSYSQLRTYMQCPLRHFFQYVLSLPQRGTSPALVLGSAVHQALALFHRSIQEKSPASPDTVKAEFLKAWKGRSKEQIVALKDDKEQDVLDQGVVLLETYLRQPPPQQIIAVEKELVSPLVNSQGEVLDAQLVAVLDLVTSDGEGIKVTDLKTSSRAYSEMESRLSLQATCYLHAAQVHYGVTSSFEYLVLVKLKRPRIQALATSRTSSDFDRLGDLVQAVNQAVTLGVHYPIESPVNCSSCPYRRPCREWQSDQTVPVKDNLLSLPLRENSTDVD